MSSPAGSASVLVEEFRSALWACRQLYQVCGQESARFHPQLIHGTPEAFVESMLDLHRGLVLKVFVTIAQADSKWSSAEKMLAEELFDFVWAKQLSGEELKEALIHIVERDHKLSWGPLVRPFEYLPPFRERTTDLFAAVSRLANVVAKCDGVVHPEELRLLEHIRHELDRRLTGVSLATDPTGKGTANRGQAIEQRPSDSQAAQTIADDVDLVRSKCELEQAPPDPALKEKSRDERLAEALAELDRLVGIEGIKGEVRGLINFLKMQVERAKVGLPATPISLHMVFTGNPGTGKTTVARIIGHLFGAMGVLAKGHLIETDRSGLVAEYAGQTGPKTNKAVDSALDGVLFIDEAYSLLAESGDDPFGAEAVAALLKRMEDDRGRLAVIIAGYTGPMDDLLKSNPGLSSRFARRFAFPDYSASELGRIFHGMSRQNHYEVPAATRARLLVGFQHLLDERDEHFGNGRLARNIFEQAIRRLANRIAPLVPVTRELLTTFEADDIVMEGVPDEVWSTLADESLQFRVECAACKHASRLRPAFLGRRVRCKKCGCEFTAEWGEPPSG